MAQSLNCLLAPWCLRGNTWQGTLVIPALSKQIQEESWSLLALEGCQPVQLNLQVQVLQRDHVSRHKGLSDLHRHRYSYTSACVHMCVHVYPPTPTPTQEPKKVKWPSFPRQKVLDLNASLSLQSSQCFAQKENDLSSTSRVQQHHLIGQDVCVSVCEHTRVCKWRPRLGPHLLQLLSTASLKTRP